MSWKLGWLALCLLVGTEALAQHQFANATDEELTELTARWAQLSTEDRRALLTEVKSRMAAQRAKGQSPVLRIRTQRRFGRTVRQPDGSLVRITTTHQIVRYRAMPSHLDAEHAFGRGFERRMADAESVSLDQNIDQKNGATSSQSSENSSSNSLEQEKMPPSPVVERPPVLRVTHPFRQ